MELKHIQRLNIHPLSRAINLSFNICTCHLHRWWYQFCKPNSYVIVRQQIVHYLSRNKKPIIGEQSMTHHIQEIIFEQIKLKYLIPAKCQKLLPSDRRDFTDVIILIKLNVVKANWKQIETQFSDIYEADMNMCLEYQLEVSFSLSALYFQ